MRIEPKERKYIIQKKCPVCGKVFIPAPFHANRDKISLKMVCSWSCVCKSERLKQAGNKKQSNKGDGQP